MLNKEQFLSLLGTEPVNVPLDVHTLIETDCGSFKRLLVEYTVEPNERVQAFLLVPKNLNEPRGGILAIHQDGGRRPYEFGKSEPVGIAGDSEMAYGRELAERGYVVICPDRFPFESRMLSKSKYAQIFDSFRIFLRNGDFEIELTEDLYAGCIGNKLEFEGRTKLGKTLHELRKAIDVLCLLPYVDKNRIGVIGHSAGGLYASLTMYLDERIKVGCSSCGNFLVGDRYKEDYLRPINGFGGGSMMPGIKKYGDIDDILAGIAPRPFLETSGDFNESDEWRVHEKAKQHYRNLGIGDRYETIAYGDGHMFRADMRMRSYEWLDCWLSKSQ